MKSKRERVKEERQILTYATRQRQSNGVKVRDVAAEARESEHGGSQHRAQRPDRCVSPRGNVSA